MTNLTKILAMASLLLVAGLPPALADEWNKRTQLTVKETVEIPGGTLQPGKYVLRLVESDANRHIVRFLNEDETEVISTVVAVPNNRLEPTGDTQFGWYETPVGQPPALRAWFYPGDTFGQEFVYPDDRALQLAQGSGRDMMAYRVADTEGQDPELIYRTVEVTTISADEDQERLDVAAAQERNAELDRTSPYALDREVVIARTDEQILAEKNAELERQMREQEARDRAAAQQRELERQQELERQRQAREQQIAQARERERAELERLRQEREQRQAMMRTRLPETAGFASLLGLMGLLSLGGAATIARVRRK